jgi:hypothetical protein
MENRRQQIDGCDDAKIGSKHGVMPLDVADYNNIYSPINIFITDSNLDISTSKLTVLCGFGFVLV